MGRIKSRVSKEGIAAIMIDGYAPESDEFEALPWRQIRKEKGVDFQEWLSRVRCYQRRIKKCYKESTYLTAYRNAIKALRWAQCPLKKKSWGYSAHPNFEPITAYAGFTTGHTHGSIESLYGGIPISPKVRKAQLPVLQNEFRNDEQNKRHHYIQNVIVYSSTPKLQCSKLEECCDTWIEILNFKEKPKDAYVNYERFSRAWACILEDMTGFHPEYPFFWHLYDHLGLDYLHV